MIEDLPYYDEDLGKHLEEKKYHSGTEIEVEFPKNIWISGKTIRAKPSPDPNEEFLRIDVELHDGRKFELCHPDCVREKK